MTYQEFRDRQTVTELSGLAHIPLKVAYTDIGEGEPLLLMHGIPTWSYLYHEVIDQLAATHRVIAPDFLGHGFSDQRDRFDRSLVAQQAMLLKLLDTLDLERVTLIGHDTGGGVALRIAIEQPERVSRLVLSNIVAYDSWPIDDMLELGNPTWRYKSSEDIREFLLGGFEQGLSRSERLTGEFKEGIVAPYLSDEGKVSLIRNASALNTSHTTSLTDRHKDIVAPTLLAWGVDDPWQIIIDGERLHSDIPNSTLVRIENASHWIPQDAPEEWSGTVLRFLKPPVTLSE